MAYSGYVKPTNKIVVAGKPLVQELKVETATNMYPGRLVTKGTNDDDILVNTASTAVIGWLGYEQITNPGFQPDTVDSIYTINAQAPVLNGGGFVIVGRLASGQSVAKDAKLKGTAAGELTAIGTEDLDASANFIVAIAEETVNASGGAADIMVKSMI